jgi:hypothetical protein
VSAKHSVCEGELRRLSDQGVLLEFRPVGNSVKVSAIDQNTGTEVLIVGPRNAAESDLREAVIRKLKYVLEKKR